MGSCHHHGKHKQHHPHNGAERRSVNGLRTEAQMADGDATTLFGIVLEVGLAGNSRWHGKVNMSFVCPRD